MTLRRVLDRNGLRDGDYGTPPSGWQTAGPVTIADHGFFGSSGQDPVDWYQKAIADWRGEREGLGSRLCMLAGDLRRLERDTVDEAAICRHITARTGVDADSVAAVLKAYLEF